MKYTGYDSSDYKKIGSFSLKEFLLNCMINLIFYIYSKKREEDLF